jgi:catechol 2,3-dioxygenase-like lactoylglutathione lyase family enzyme
VQILGTHHVGLTTGRFELLRQFYVEKLGLPVVGGFPGHDILFVDAGTTTIELIGEEPATVPGASAGIDAKPDDRPRRGGWHHLAWEVADVDASYADLLTRGVEPHSPPEDFPAEAPSMRIAFLRDPDGNLIELVQPISSRSQDPDQGAPTSIQNM